MHINKFILFVYYKQHRVTDVTYTCFRSTHGKVGTMASFGSHVKFPIGFDMHSNAIPRLSLSMAIWTEAKKTQNAMDKRQEPHNLGFGARSK